jgi:hypothetical protein
VNRDGEGEQIHPMFLVNMYENKVMKPLKLCLGVGGDEGE